MKIATWNVNSIKVRLPHVLAWCKTAKPDVLALQETKVPDAQFPVSECIQAGYEVQYSGQRTYNGMAILSRMAGKDKITDIPDLDDPQRRILALTFADVRVINLYVPNGASLDSDKFVYKMDWLTKVRAFIASELKKYPQCVVLGDFNIAPRDADVHDPKAWEGHVLVSPQERSAFQDLLGLGLQDTFLLFDDHTVPYSWWDYRQAGFRRDRGLRIDHLLASEALAASCSACAVDKAPRGWERPSDHAPVWAVYG